MKIEELVAILNNWRPVIQSARTYVEGLTEKDFDGPYIKGRDLYQSVQALKKDFTKEAQARLRRRDGRLRLAVEELVVEYENHRIGAEQLDLPAETRVYRNVVEALRQALDAP